MKVIRKKLVETVTPQYDWTTQDTSKLNCTLITENNDYAVYEIKDQAAASALGNWVPDWDFTDWSNWNTIRYRAMSVLVPRHKRDKYLLTVDHILFFLPKDPAVYSPYILCICRYGKGEQGLPTPFVFFNEDFRKLENNRIPSNKFPAIDYAGVHITSRRGDTGVYAIDNTLVHIGSEVRNLVVPSGITTIDCEKPVNQDNWAAPIAHKGPRDLRSITIPSSVKTIDEYAFADCTMLTKVDIKNGLSTIKRNAFWGCKKLTELFLPQSLTTIGERAFEKAGLINVELPDHLPKLEPFIFNDCPNLKTVKLPKNLQTIGRQVFYDCYELESIEIPDTVTLIDYGAFANTPKLRITLGSGLTVLGDSAFSVSGIQSITIPGSVKQIGSSCFSSTKLSDLTLENGIQTIGNYAFGHNKLLTEVAVPDSVTKLGERVFWDNPVLAKATIGSGVLELPTSTFRDCQKLAEVKLGDNIELIGTQAFENCKSLETIALPEALNEIRFKAFASSGLTEITIPRNVSVIGEAVFNDCQSLDKITFRTVPKIEQDIIAGINHPVDITFLCIKAQLLNARNVASTISNQACSNGQVIHCLDGNVIW